MKRHLNAPPAQAFDAFVTGIKDWWPMTAFSMSRGALSLGSVLGGRIVETSLDGENLVWGHISALEILERIELSQYVGGTVDTATQISVTFARVESGNTLVRLVQSGWETLGEKAVQIRTQNDGAWRQFLGSCYAGLLISHSKETPGA